MNRTAITYLFVPGDRPERFDKARASGADTVIVDLEDAVAPGDKDAARVHLREWLARQPENGDRIAVRINDTATPWFDADVELFREGCIAIAMLPKAETVTAIATVRGALPSGGRVLPIIETARGVENVGELAAAPGVERLAFGTLDYAVDLGLSGDERGLMYAAARIAHASRCAGIASPIMGVTPAIGDDVRLLADLEFGRAFGFGAKLCIHPRQVTAIREALMPTADEVDWARRVLAAASAGPGATQVDGRMVDRPVVLKAQAILDRAPT